KPLTHQIGDLGRRPTRGLSQLGERCERRAVTVVAHHRAQDFQEGRLSVAPRAPTEEQALFVRGPGHAVADCTLDPDDEGGTMEDLLEERRPPIALRRRIEDDVGVECDVIFGSAWAQLPRPKIYHAGLDAKEP